MLTLLRKQNKQIRSSDSEDSIMESIIGFLQGTLDFKNADVCDDLMDRLHHHVTAGLLALFATATYMYAQ